MGNMSENLFQAIDIVASKKLEGLKYDKTLLCEVIDSTDAKLGQYRVTDGTSTFLAYSDNTSYKNGMSVYVTIPESDYSNKKIITGKYVENGGEHYTYVAPFEGYLDVTNNYIDIENNSATLLANGDRSEQIIWTWIRNEANKKTIPKEYTKMGIRASFQTWLGHLQPVTGTYGIRIDITSREETESNNSGSTYKHYSYYLDSSDFYGDVYNFETYYPQEAVFNIEPITEIQGIQVVFYQNDNFYTLSKEKISTMEDGVVIPDNIYLKDTYLSFGFDADEFTTDTIFLYTLDGETYDPSTQNVKVTLADGTTALVNKNKKTLQLRWVHFLGDKETLVVDTQDELNNVGATVHWYHYVQEEGVCDALAGHFWQEIETLDKDGKLYNAISIVVEPNITLQTERYKVIIESPGPAKLMDSIEVAVAAAGDAEYYGAYDRDDDQYIITKKEEDFATGFSTGTIHEDIKKVEDAIAALEGANEINTQALLDFNQKQKETLEFMLKTYRNKVRQIWADAEASKTRYISNTFILTNETLVPNNATVNLVQGLKILVDLKGLKGNYCLYGMTNEILNSSEASRIRTLEAKYDSLITGEPDLDKASTICWKIPADNTMIAAPVLGTDYVTENYVNSLEESKREKYTTLDYISTTMTTEDGTEVNLVDENGNLISYEGYYYLIRQGTEDYSKYDSDKDGQGEEDTKQQISVKQTYKIKKYYQQSATNNTIHCIVNKNAFDYKASATLNFGHHGSNGSDTTLILQMREFTTNNDGSIQPGNLLSALTPGKTALIEARLFNYKNEEVPINNVTWDMWAANTKNNIQLQGEVTYTETIRALTEVDGEEVEGAVDISIYCQKVSASEISGDITYEYFMHNILEAKVKYGTAEFGGQATPGYDMENVGTDGQGTEIAPKEPQTRDVVLSAYYPIGFTTNSEMFWAEVPTQVVYDSSGSNPSYFKDSFKILKENGQEEPIITSGVVFSDEATNASYYPSIKKHGEGKFSLNPNNMYLNGLNNKVTLVCETALGYWVQPIVILQNRWPSAMLNAWDGSLTIDEKNGTILSTMVGAGKKEDDNSFTGVLMGDVETGSGIETKNHTGVYGYHHGQQSFGFLDDGTAFIGKQGKGRIEFNGNSGQIKSMSYSQSGGTGMLIDLDDGVIEMKGASGSVGENTTKSKKVYKPSGSLIRLDVAGGEDKPFFQIKTASSDDPLNEGQSREIMYVGVSKYHLQTANFTKSNATSGQDGKGMKIDLMKGSIEGYDFSLKGYENDGEYAGSYFSLNSNGDPFFRVHYEGPTKDASDNSITTDLDLVNITKSAFVLKSHNWSSDRKTGLKLDMTNGKMTGYDFELVSKGAQDSSYVRFSNIDPYLVIKNKDGNTLIRMSDNDYYLQSADENAKFNIDSGELVFKGSGGGQVVLKGNGNPFFKIHDGSTNIFYAANNDYYMQSSRYSGDEGGIKINFTDGTLEGGSGDTKWNITKSGEATFRSIKATDYGYIGPFTINGSSIYKGTGTYHSSSTDIYLGTSGISVRDNFKVTSDGHMYAKGTVSIGGEVTIEGKTTIQDNIYISGNATITGNGYIQGGGYQFTSSGGKIGGWDIKTDTLESEQISLHSNGNIYLKSGGGKIMAWSGPVRSRAMADVNQNFVEGGSAGTGTEGSHYLKFTTNGITLHGTTDITGSVSLSGSLTVNGAETMAGVKYIWWDCPGMGKNNFGYIITNNGIITDAGTVKDESMLPGKDTLDVINCAGWWAKVES
jgi:hypothetical protein